MKSDHGMEDFFLPEIISDLELVEKEIQSSLSSDTRLLEEMASHLITAGGKRVRPALTLLSYRAAGGKDIEEVLLIAAAIELIHTASLIHDDINDETDKRRNVLTTNMKYGTNNALISGDYLFVKAFYLGGKYDWNIVGIIAKACSNLAEGEIRQGLNRYNTEISYEEYLTTITKKTASLITASVRVGAVLSGTSQEKVEALTDYANNIGVAFQITDDILDISGETMKTGKPIGNDIREGQLTLLTIKALEMATMENGRKLRKIISKKKNTDEEIQDAISIIKDTNAMETAFQYAEKYGNLARESLYKLDENDFRDNLELIVEMILQRYF